MQIPDMRTLRTLFFHKHHLLLNFNLHRSPTSSNSSFSCEFALNPHISRHSHRTLHSANHLDGPVGWTAARSASTDDENPSVRVKYDPIIGCVETQDGIGPDANERRDREGDRRDGSDCMSFSSEDLEDSASRRIGEVSGSRPISNFAKDKAYGVVKRGHLIGGSQQNVGVGRKKKNKTNWVCSYCGYSNGQWWGTCRSCSSVGTIKEFKEAAEYGGGKTTGIEVSENVVRSLLPQQSTEAVPMRLTDVNRGYNQLNWRIPLSGLFGSEVARVLGGGLVPGRFIADSTINYTAGLMDGTEKSKN